MSTMTLTFDMEEEWLAAQAATRAASLVCALETVRNAARSVDKNGSDPHEALTVIRGIVCEALEGLE